MKVVGHKNVISTNFLNKSDTVEFDCKGKVMTQAIIKCIKEMCEIKAPFLF